MLGGNSSSWSRSQRRKFGATGHLRSRARTLTESSSPPRTTNPDQKPGFVRQPHRQEFALVAVESRGDRSAESQHLVSFRSTRRSDLTPTDTPTNPMDSDGAGSCVTDPVNHHVVIAATGSRTAGIPIPTPPGHRPHFGVQ